MGLDLMPNGKLVYKRGEIWWVNLNPVVGNEVGKQRPCLILQNDVGNKSSSTTIVVPLMPGHKTFPFVVNIMPTAENGLDKARNINLSQLRVVDAQRISNKLGLLEEIYWENIEKATGIELGFSESFTIDKSQTE
jgi:mRNA interferase MazF